MSVPLRIVALRFDLETSPQKIEHQLIDFLRGLRWKARGFDPADIEAAREADRWSEELLACSPSQHDGAKIHRRADPARTRGQADFRCTREERQLCEACEIW